MDFIFGLIQLYILYKIITFIYRKVRGYIKRSKSRASNKRWEDLMLQKIEDARISKLKYQKKLDKPVSDEPLVFGCKGHPNRTLALRYGTLNISNGYENDTIRILKKGFVEGFEDRGHYYAVLCDYENTKVRVVIEQGADFINTFYPLDDKNWFSKFEDLEKLLKNSDSFSLKELAKYYIDIVVVPSLKSS